MSEIKVDNLTGKTTANDITVTVGATATASLEQGLAKVWSRFNGTAATTTDSFNQASFVDAGTGIYQINMSNPYTGNVGAHTTCSGAYHAINRSTGTATQIELGTYNSSHSSVDESRCSIISHGDLA